MACDWKTNLILKGNKIIMEKELSPCRVWLYARISGDYVGTMDSIKVCALQAHADDAPLWAAAPMSMADGCCDPDTGKCCGISAKAKSTLCISAGCAISAAAKGTSFRFSGSL